MEFNLDHQEFVFKDLAYLNQNVFLYGLSGVGVEIVKNLILSGFKHITIQDGEECSQSDVGTSFAFNEDNLQQNRALIAYNRLKALNSSINLTVNTQTLNKECDLNVLGSFHFVILCNQQLSLQIAVDNFCASRIPPIKFVSVNVYGVLSSIFCDLGTDVMTQMHTTEEMPTKIPCMSSSDLHPSESQNKNDCLLSYEVLEKQIQSPTLIECTIGKYDQKILHLGLVCLYQFLDTYNRLPNIQDLENILNIADIIKVQYSVSLLSTDFFHSLLNTFGKVLPPLVSFAAGLAAHEVTKARSRKFNCCHQWFHFAVPEIGIIDRTESFQSYICLSDKLLEKLRNSNLLMVGCGTTNCEILKNIALSITPGGKGEITILDDDIIGKTHLTRHFLFSPHHINQPKCIIASAEVKKINSALKIYPKVNSLSTDMEYIYDENFFQMQNVVIANVDNIFTRKYLDKCCIRSKKPWIDTGTSGSEGHVQVILPHLTEHYAAVNDRTDNEFPYCTLKSFPFLIEHTIQWAQEKFINLFTIKPLVLFNVCTKNGNLEGLVQKLEAGGKVNDLAAAIKLLFLQPKEWSDCILFARKKFEKYFNHKAHQLLHLFPLETTSQGMPFWQYPKSPPTPILFDWNDSLHRLFIISTAKLYATVWHISYTQEELQHDHILGILQNTKIVEFQPNPDKRVVVSENEEKPESSSTVSEEGIVEFVKILKEMKARNDLLTITPMKYNKYDDVQGQIDFVYASSTLRALMYNIETISYLQTRFIAGKIIPSLPTTNAVIGGLATLELFKLLKGVTKDQHSNYYINLALPSIVTSEPANPQIIRLREDLSYTVWDYWEVVGKSNETLSQFIDRLREQHKIEPTMILHGAKMIWVAMMYGHEKRKSQTMVSLLAPNRRDKYIELSVTAYDMNGEEEVTPPIRYHFYNL